MASSEQIRSEFIRFFEKRGHTLVPSSAVVPKDDPTLLFANAGMNQFKDVFLAVGTRPYHRATNSQKCIRVSGKHNDLEEVGVDTYHHTFFEMLGNWSFGDYFKAEAIEWAWTLLTEVWGLPKDRLYVTVFGGDEAMGLAADDEAAKFWKEVTDIDPSHIMNFGTKDNFWQMAETGPCGPCSEIHIDLTHDGSGGKRVNAGDPKVMEIWNLVFIQFDRHETGKLTPLPAKHVDTGMGLERICRVIKHLPDIKHGKVTAGSNYGTDLFVPIIQKIEELTGCIYGAARTDLADRYDSDTCDNIVDIACRVIADHVRTLTFAITDGAAPSNEGRGYVIRRLLRRAARYGRKLNVHDPFIYKLVPTVIEIMGKAFPEIVEKGDFLAEIIRAEEQAFGRTLDRGLEIFEQVAAKVKDMTFPGDEAFKLYDTYGFPLDLTQLMARERGLSVDEKRFNELMSAQRQRARQAGKTTVSVSALGEGLDLPSTDDLYKYRLEPITATVLGWICENEWISKGTLKQAESVDLVVDRTCFYAESGGQVGDMGKILTDHAEFVVENTQKIGDATVLHRGKLVRGTLSAGDHATLVVERVRREDTMNNHTATHLLQQALRNVLGDHVKQAGSLVCDEYLRFDFTHNKALTNDEIRQVEHQVQERIDQALPVTIEQIPLKQALDLGVMALFGEKYGEEVRVVAIGVPESGNLAHAFSKELCGGTHVDTIAKIMDFLIIREESLQTGIRRITAKTGRALRRLLHERYELTNQLSQTLKMPADQLTPRIEALLEETRKLKRQLREGPAGIDLTASVDQLVEKAIRIGPATVVSGELPNVPVEQIRVQADRVKKKLSNAVVVFGTCDPENKKVLLLAAVSDDLIKHGLSAGEIAKRMASIVGGSGGGKPHLAQAGGKLPEKLPEALACVEAIVRDALG